MVRVALLAALLVVAGCLGDGGPEAPGDGGPDPRGPDGSVSWPGVGPCAATLHVWIVPLDELAERTPPEFPPTALQQEGVDAPLGRIVFYLYDCPPLEDGGEPGLLGLLGVRVHAPEAVAPPPQQPDWAVTPWVSVYTLAAFASGPMAGVLDAAGLAFEPVTGSVELQATPAPDTPIASATLTTEAGATLETTMAGAPTRVESFDRPERYFHVVPGGHGEVRWLDVSFNMTLWETDGTVSYSDGSPWDAAVGSRVYDAGVDHHAMEAVLDLVPGRGSLAGSALRT